MAGFDDETGSADMAPGAVDLTGPRDGRKGHPRTIRKRQLRLICGNQVFGQSHNHRINQKRFTVKTILGSNVVIPNFGYNYPVGKLTPDIQMRREAMLRLMKGGAMLPWSILAGVSYTTFIRLCKGDNPPKIGEYEKLLSLKDYPETLSVVRKEYRREISPGAEASLARILDVLGDKEFDSLAFAIEGMARIVGNENVIGNFRERLSEVQTLARQMADSKKETRKFV